jgi:hypothetical protein
MFIFILRIYADKRIDPAGVIIGLGMGEVGVFNGVMLSRCPLLAGEGDIMELDLDSSASVFEKTKS